jgi:hypothetical protein
MVSAEGPQSTSLDHSHKVYQHNIRTKHFTRSHVCYDDYKTTVNFFAHINILWCFDGRKKNVTNISENSL